MNQNLPLISVIIPTHNNEKTINTAINSILGQTYKNIEVIVVNDNSTDGTRDAVQILAQSNHRIKLIEVEIDDPDRFDTKLNRNINAGYSARNVGMKHTRGEYITFQDADDASLLNRIEVQYGLLQKHNAIHITTDCVSFDKKYLGKKLNVDTFLKEHRMKISGPEEIYKLSQKAKGIVAKISPSINRCVPFYLKRQRFAHKLFFGTLDGYPGAANSPLFKREVAEKVLFRKLSDRIWPSFMGRGADRDFNFQVAETFRNSYTFLIPLYMWRVEVKNSLYADNLDKFILK